jgi:hypothetical protein
MAGQSIAKRLRVPWIADFRDPFAHIPGYRPPPLAWFACRLLEGRILSDAAAIIMNTDAAAEEYRRIYPKSAHKIHAIWNGFDPADPLEAMAVRQGPTRILAHPGNLYGGRDPTFLLQSLRRLRMAGEPNALHTQVLLVGPNELSEDERREITVGASEGWITSIPIQVPKQEALRMTQEAHGLLLVLPRSSTQIPGKAFEYLRIGRPILALAPRRSAVAEVLASAGVPHVTVHPDDPASVADEKIVQFLSLPHKPVRANEWFYQKFSAIEQTRELAAIFDRLVYWRH